MIKKANLEALMPTIYTKLKSLGEINDVVPISSIVSGLNKGDARAYVSNEDKNTDGVPDKIYIVYPKLNIDLQQDLSGVTTADIMAFPNVESQKMHQVSNILGTVINVLNHDQDHLKGFKSSNNVDEFSPEHSAEHAGDEAAKLFINKYTSLKDKGNQNMIKELTKLSNHLRSINETSIAEELDMIIKSSATTNQSENKSLADLNEEVGGMLDWMNESEHEPESEQPKPPEPKSESELLVTASIIIEKIDENYSKVDTNFNVDRLKANVDEARKDYEAAMKRHEALQERARRGERVQTEVGNLEVKAKNLNTLIRELNTTIEEAMKEESDYMGFGAELRGNKSGPAAKVEEDKGDDQSFNLDNLFASSIMGSRNIK